MPKSRFYKILGLTPSASKEDIRKKYRQLVMKYHPDRNPSPQAEKIFIELTEAYDFLTHKNPPEKKIAITKTPEEEYRERVKVARERYNAQILKEKLENEAYFKELTGGIKWKSIRLSAALGILVSLFLLLDLILPHHLEEDSVTQYRNNVAYSTNGQVVSLVKTSKENYFWISGISYSLYGSSRNIYVETSWFFHNTIRLISREKLGYNFFDTHFTFYRSTWIIVPIFLLPAFTLYYKRKKITFTFLFYTCFYGVNILMLIYLFSGNRWAHILTFGFL